MTAGSSQSIKSIFSLHRQKKTLATTECFSGSEKKDSCEISSITVLQMLAHLHIKCDLNVQKHKL